MSMFQKLIGNAVEIEPAEAAAEFAELLIEGEQVLKGYKLMRDILVFTNYRMLSLDKQGVTGKKQELITLPYRNISRIAKVSAGTLDLNAELHIYPIGEGTPLSFQFAKGANIDDVYKFLSHYLIASG